MMHCHRSVAHLYRASVCHVAAVALMALPVVFTSTNAAAQAAAAKPGVDVLTFTNGDQLTGTLVSESGGSVVFHSDMSGDIKVDWSKIKSLHTGGKYAVISPTREVEGRPAGTAGAGGNAERRKRSGVCLWSGWRGEEHPHQRCRLCGEW